jgi:NAD+ diphosphatase
MIPFTNNPLDRSADKRKDADWLRARLDEPSTIFIAMRDGKPLVRDGALAHIAPTPNDTPFFLGAFENDLAFFAIESEVDREEGTFEDFRSIALTLPPADAAIAATARSLFEWHRRHRFCSACGQPSQSAAAGWQRVCPPCGAEHFPRVDPVVIMLPLFGDRCLLGRQSIWPKGRMSALAGFVEPGETIEEACAREVKEEAGLIATRVTYFASQPWPFPSSLMIGLFAEVASDRAIADGAELEEVRWLTRDEARAALEDRHPEVLPPSALGISRHLIEAWAFSE